MTRISGRVKYGVRTATVSVAVLALAALAACGSGGSSAGSASSSANGVLTLKFITADTGGQLDMYKAAIPKYEALHPNIKIALTPTDYTSYSTNRKLIFSSDDAPDIGQVAQSYGMRVLVQNKLLVNMDPYAQKFGWADKIPPKILDEFRVPEDGSSFGTGPLWGVASAGHMVGIFYNKDKAKALGVDPTKFKSIDDLDAALAKAKAAGEPGIMVGATDNNGDGIAKLVEPLLSSYMNLQGRLDWIHGVKGSTIETPEALAAAKKLVEWKDNGYLFKDFAGTAGTDAMGKFVAGEGLFYIGEDQHAKEVIEGLGDKGGFVPFPPATAGAPLQLTGSATQPLGIASSSKHPDEAADFINYFVTTQAQQTFIDNGLSPLVSDDSLKVPKTGVSADIWNTWEEVSQHGAVTQHLDWATTTIQGVFNPGAVGLVEGTETPESYLKKLQDDWNSSWNQ
jgi:raffinose/stachyose/melibiose transport system substrate-binding protein